MENSSGARESLGRQIENDFFENQAIFAPNISDGFGDGGVAEEITSSTLFVGDLSITCTEDDLLELFSQYVEKDHLASAHILRCRTTGTSLCYGFVTITSAMSEVEASLVRKELHGMYLFGRTLKLRSAKTEIGPDGEIVNSPGDIAKSNKALYKFDLPKISVYVRFQASHTSNSGYINEENIRQIFELSDEIKFMICESIETGKSSDAVERIESTSASSLEGNENGDTLDFAGGGNKTTSNASIVDISIRKLAVDRRTNLQYGYGFIFYHDNAQGLAAALYTLQSKANVQAIGKPAVNDPSAGLHPITYTLQSSKGLESYLNYIKSTAVPNVNWPAIASFLEMVRIPSNSDFDRSASGGYETVVLNDPDSGNVATAPHPDSSRGHRVPRPYLGSNPVIGQSGGGGGRRGPRGPGQQQGPGQGRGRYGRSGRPPPKNFQSVPGTYSYPVSESSQGVPNPGRHGQMPPQPGSPQGYIPYFLQSEEYHSGQFPQTSHHVQPKNSHNHNAYRQYDDYRHVPPRGAPGHYHDQNRVKHRYPPPQQQYQPPPQHHQIYGNPPLQNSLPRPSGDQLPRDHRYDGGYF